MVIVHELFLGAPEQIDPRDAGLDDSVVFSTNGLGSPRQNDIFWHREFEKTNLIEASVQRPLKSYDEYVAFGTHLVDCARQAESKTGLIEAAAFYRQARIELMGAVRVRPLPEDIRLADTSTVGADVLFLIADCLDKEALAPETTSSPLLDSIARRKILRGQAENTRVIADFLSIEVSLAA